MADTPDLGSGTARCVGSSPILGNRCSNRCSWCERHPTYIHYHDTEWGVPLKDSRALFELLILESMQAGLSWLTILLRREAFRKAFAQFDPKKMLLLDVDTLMQDPGIIRNRAKITAAIHNAKIFLEIPDFEKYIWDFVDGKPIQNSWKDLKEVPCSTPLSDRMAKELKARGFKFLGTKICYSFLQAAGLVNDHLIGCFRFSEITPLSLVRS